jgi:hypothetical protein
VLYTTRPHDLVVTWLREHELDCYFLEVAREKPLCCAYVDDRGLKFNGDFNATLAELDGFTAWWEERQEADAADSA